MRRPLRILIVAVLLFAAWDATRPPRAQAGVVLALSVIRTYQSTLSPILERTGTRCRFTTSCSRYALIVIARDGWPRGSWRAAGRVLRCGPWTPPGSVDDP